jgi:two-component system, OmpR family, alkaline phosphatase synthesis response regulator PhoP
LVTEESSLRVLVVDDEPDLRDLFKITLEYLNYEVITCNNGEDAIKLAYEERPSLIFLDVVMPGISGFEVCRYLKNDAATKDIFIVIVSALSREVDYEMSIQVGADDFITKPFHIDMIKKVLKTTISPFLKVEKWKMKPTY